MSVVLVECDHSHRAEILAIFNDAIANTTALWEYEPRSMATIDAWWEDKVRGRYPIIGSVDERGRLLGFGTYGPFRSRPAYKYTIEHSVYVDALSRGKGIGTLLLAAIIERARQQQYHVLVGGIAADNAVSIALHQRFGFERCGRVKQAGFKFGRWLDLEFYQLLLETPQHPIDG